MSSTRALTPAEAITRHSAPACSSARAHAAPHIGNPHLEQAQNQAPTLQILLSPGTREHVAGGEGGETGEALGPGARVGARDGRALPEYQLAPAHAPGGHEDPA